MELIDTDVLIDVQRDFPPAIAWFEAQVEPATASGMTILELVQSAKNKEQLSESSSFARSLVAIWPTLKEYQNALLLFETYHLSHSLGLIDSLIAATALGRDATLFTFNVKHFRCVPGLRVMEPYSRS